MRFTRLFVLALLATTFHVDSAAARNTDVPTEFPPSSFEGRQYVDSKGCIFVRAGIDGAVNWVPRVSRQRQHLCGARPNFVNAPAPAPQRVQQATVIAPPKAEAPPVSARPAPEPARAVAPAPARAAAPRPAPLRAAAQVPRPAQAPRPVTTRQPMRTVASIQATPRLQDPAKTAPSARVVRSAPVAVAVPTETTYTTAWAACQGGTATVARRTGDGRLVQMRCGPQTTSHVTTVRRGEAPGTGKNVHYNRASDARSASGSTRIVPRHVHEKRDDQVVTIPEGYRAAFEDDRLNRKRANQSIDGYLATQLVWTNTVPRRLVDRSSGRDVTAKYPRLIYPYTDYATQQAALSTQGAASRVVAPRPAVTAMAPQRTAAPAPRSPVASGSGRFVQVGTFGVPSNAQATAARLEQMGLPVAFGTFNRGGKSYRVVLAGPFSSGSQIDAALGTARRAGFGDAFVK